MGDNNKIEVIILPGKVGPFSVGEFAAVQLIPFDSEEGKL